MQSKQRGVALYFFCVAAGVAAAMTAVAAPPDWVMTTNFPAIKDAHVSKIDPDTAYGTSNTMTYFGGWYVYEGGTQKLIYPSVDFGNVIADMPVGSQVYGARMLLTRAAGGVSSAQRIHLRATNWNENTATWNSGAPAYISWYINRPAWTPSPATVAYDVTCHLDAGMRGGNASACFGLSGGGEDNGSSGSFYTREETTPANRPILTVDYVPANTKIAHLRQGLDGYTGVVDTYITPRYPTNNHGAVTFAFMENPWGGYVSRVLVKFDLDNAIPVGARVTQAILALMPYQTQVSNYVNVAARECLREWTSVANYSNYTATAQWQLPDGLGANDQAASPVTTTNTIATDQGMIYLDVTSSVNKWMRGLATNNGWFIDGGPNQIIYPCLSEHASAGARPQLWLQYETVQGTVIFVQ